MLQWVVAGLAFLAGAYVVPASCKGYSMLLARRRSGRPEPLVDGRQCENGIADTGAEDALWLTVLALVVVSLGGLGLRLFFLRSPGAGFVWAVAGLFVAGGFASRLMHSAHAGTVKGWARSAVAWLAGNGRGGRDASA